MKKRYIIVVSTPVGIKRDIKELDQEEADMIKRVMEMNPSTRILLFLEEKDAEEVFVALQELREIHKKQVS